MRRRGLLVTLVATAWILSGCAVLGDGDTLEVTAEFGDVFDLVEQGSVQYNNNRVGVVTDIQLTENHTALVTMEVDPDIAVPNEVEPVVARTSVLGERYIDLVPTNGTTCSNPPGPGCLTAGDLGAGTARADLEDLVDTGTELLVVVTADTVNQAMVASHEILVGREQLIDDFITDVRTLAQDFTDREEELLALIDSLDTVTAAYAGNAEENAAVLTDLRTALAALEDLDSELLDTLDDVGVLAEEAGSFLSENQQDLHQGLRRLSLLLEEVAIADQHVETLLRASPRYLKLIGNGSSQVLGVERDETNVWLDTIICGLNDVPGDQSRECDPTNPGENTDYPYHPVPQECWEFYEPCTGIPDSETNVMTD